MITKNSEQCGEVTYLNAGDSSILMVLGNEISENMHRRVKSLYYYLRENILPGIIEVVPAYRSITVYYDPLVVLYSEVIEWLKKANDMDLAYIANEKTRRFYIPVCFGGQFGPDLCRVAQFHNLSEQKVIEIFCAQDYLNYFTGFMPGKPYLGKTPEALDTPRLDVPRIKLPSGTVAILSQQVALFGIEQPTGANCIGRSPVLIYDIRKEDPILLKMGDLVRFFPISEEEFMKISREVEAMEYQVRMEYERGENSV